MNSPSSAVSWKPSLPNLLKLPAEGLSYLREHGLAKSWSMFNSREAHPFLQFCKYALCGLASTFVVLAIYTILGNSVLPCFQGMELSDGSLLDDATRKRNNIIANLIAFFPANCLTFYLNVLWVFEPGRHSKWKEFGLFTLISALSFGAGVFGGPELLIGKFGLPSWISQMSFMVTSALVNFVCRKFLIFKG